MTDQRIKKLIEDGDRLFSEKLVLDSLHQEIALNFYPEMAEFTSTRSRGEDYADHLTTSYPLLARRTLGDAFSALLRPVNLDTTSPGVWFGMTTDRPDQEDKEGKQWLEWATGVQRRAMYDRQANFVRATKEGDHSFAAFGQCVLTLELNREGNGLLYRSWHLRDVAWQEGPEGGIDGIHRRWNPTASQLAGVFRDKVHSNIKEKMTQDPHSKVKARHIVMKTEDYESRDEAGSKIKEPWVSIWLDIDNDHVMEEVGSPHKQYIIPRWVTIPGSQYASSPAVTVALPDARLIQAMTLTLLEAGEKVGDPPVVATQESIRSDIQLFAGGVTWVDAEYDEKLGEALRPLYHPNMANGVQLGLGMRGDLREQINDAFFLDSLSLPPADTGDMTAFEVGQRVSEWIRRAMPIFEPMEFEYNGPLTEETFELMLRNGAFGPMDSFPQSLRGQDIQFKFESPLHESAERRKGQKFLEAKQALIEAAELDPGSAHTLDARQALRDVLGSIGVPTEWTRDEEEVEERAAADQEQAEAQQTMGEIGGAAAMSKDLGSAIKDLSQAGATANPLGQPAT